MSGRLPHLTDTPVRLALVLISTVAGGCLHGTPMMTPETLPVGRTRVEAGFGFAPFQPSVRVRHGLTPRVEVGARADVFALDVTGATVGADASVQLVRPGAGVGVVATLGVSGTAVASGTLERNVGLFYAYPGIVVGRETLYGGTRALVPLDRTGDSAVGAFVGVRVPASSGASRHYLGIEVAAYRFSEERGIVPFPALTFGRRQNR